ncbi:AimR family lysis-lysogeny pheromone receptor [Virgibacillus doumboii]|uniref:AimR family lysis-lysogeny pheromone receptor n=1 Tax=Virgibacillus doumboii TaxID=2697503 RepID=UPI0013DF5B04|nr:AimR family lysis-lysogeny pheromone receptor [Virgibacillus doumboii]
MHFSKADLMPDSMITISNNDRLTLGQVAQMLSYEHEVQTAKELTRKFCLQSSSDEVQKTGMEFLYMNGYYEDLELLIKKNKESINRSNQKWAKVYQVTMDRKLNRYPLNELLMRAERIKTDDPALKIVIEFIKISIYYSLSEYGKLGNFLEKQQRLFEKVEDQYLLSFYNLRLYQNLFMYYLVRNEVIMARKYAFRMLNQSTNPDTISRTHINLGLSYLFDTYYQAMYHMTEALKISEKFNLHRRMKCMKQNNIPFISAHFKNVDGITSTDKSEQAHLEIAKGNFRQAEAILDEIPINSPYRIYYLGMAKQDKSILLQAYNNFIEQRSDYFFSRLPLNALKQLGA